MAQKRPIVFALVGGVASGKSAVARAFAERGARVIDADAVGHEVLGEADVKRDLAAAFGLKIFLASGEVERAVLAKTVFGDADKLKRLNGITHPRIRALIKDRLAAALKEKGLRAIVLDVSLLLESGAYEGAYDRLVFVEADEHNREKRAATSRGWDKGEVRRRQKHQLPLEEKQKRAAVVIDNNGTLEDLDRQVGNLWKKFVGRS
ncbi:MAG: dephospho-CoA kinase [Planctomycetes bacterium]|nr:dephospho-CoA kinase [Planctomycetota bacterium]